MIPLIGSTKSIKNDTTNRLGNLAISGKKVSRMIPFWVSRMIPLIGLLVVIGWYLFLGFSSGV